MLRLSILLCGLLANGALGQPRPLPFEGRWADDLAICDRDAVSGSDHIPLVVTRRTIDSYASACRITSLRRTGPQRWRARTACRNEGEGENEPDSPADFTLRVRGDRLTLTTGGTDVQELRRCPSAAPRP